MTLSEPTPFRSAFARVLALVLVALSPIAATAQTAPAGNAHPPTQSLTDSAELPNPFGDHGTDLSKVPGAEAKAQLAAGVDLEPLRGLAVFHNGRVKVLDTLAREMVSLISMRKKYSEERADGAKVAYDPLFTLLDMVIDPAYYYDKPLLGIDYLPLRRAFVEAEERDEKAQSRLLRSGRIAPALADRHGREVASRYMSNEPYAAAMNRLDQSMALFMQGHLNFVMVAPPGTDDPWSHLSTLPPESPVRKAAADLGAAWRAGDASKVNAAVSALAAELPQINASVYPTTRLSVEMLYNRVNSFEWGYWAYFLSLVSLLLAFGTSRRWLAMTGGAFLVIALALHAFGFISRCIIAERFAIQNQFESMTGLSLFAAVVGAAIMIARRQWLFGAASAAVGFLVLITATQAGIPGVHIEREAAILNTSVLLKYHVTTVLVSYGLIALGLIVSVFYLFAHYLGRSSAAAAEPVFSAALSEGVEPAPATRARLLSDLDTAQMIVLQLAFWTLGVGILLGAWWADHSWGRWWAFDPKETWALLTWIIYLIVIHVRLAAPGKKAVVTAWLSVVGFIVMLWTYFGVNLLLPGLHAYA